MRTIQYGSEYMKLHDNGNIERTGSRSFGPSGQWRVTGAVTLNNFGKVTQRFSLGDILHMPSTIPWKFKNGKQRTFICDFDHGSNRMWTNSHKVF